MNSYRIQDYGLIGNCETAALINPDGGIDWLCLPAFDSGSFFGALLDREKGGEFRLHPVGRYEVERGYRGDSAILETRFRTPEGTAVLVDFFAIARRKEARFYDFTSLAPLRRLVRLIRHESGPALAMELELRARPDYARRGPAWRARPGGYETYEAAFFTSFPLTNHGGDLEFRFRVEPGQTHFAVLDYGVERTAPTLEAIASWEEITEAFWREWNLFNYYRGPHREVVRRSAVTLKLLTCAESGAIVAAPTTSLPEVPKGEANWDYRYTWLRDAALLIGTLFRIGYSGEAKAFLQFIIRQARSNPDDEQLLAPVQPIRSGETPPEETIPHLAGYREARPVRRGNRARNQFQLDSFAHVLEALFYFKQTGGKLDDLTKQLITRATDTLMRRWREPDNGIWETVECRLYTHGKVAAWAGLAAAARLLPTRRAELARECEKIRSEILRLTNHSAGRYLPARSDSSEIDASALLAFTTNLLPLELARATRQQVEQRLTDGALVYRNEELRAQGEGAFLLCSFWLINHLIKEGALERAESVLEDLLAHLSPLGLLAEEVDAATGDFLGNFPQAFSHLGLIGTILNLELARRDRRFAGLSDHEKFERTVGRTIGVRGVLAGFWRVPRTVTLLFSGRSKVAKE